jgi:hypothetical protein
MLLSTSALLAAAVFVGEVAAHGYVPFIRINGTLINGWDVDTGGRLFLHATGVAPNLPFGQMVMLLPNPFASFAQPSPTVVSSAM